MRLNMRSSVVFPEPLSPTSAMHSPGATARITPAKASTAPYRFVISFAANAAGCRAMSGSVAWSGWRVRGLLAPILNLTFATIAGQRIRR
jgi:hypothetical protein